MESHRVSTTQSGISFQLRLNTRDLGQKGQRLTPPNSLLTPISANCEDRKSSVSSWSYTSHDLGSESSQPSSASSFQSCPDPPSSVSSFQACPEPSTPQHQGLPMDYSFGSSSTSFEDLTSPADHFGSRSGYLQNSTLVQEPLDVIHRTGEFQSHPGWVSTSNALFNLQSHGVHDMMPASGDFSSAMGASLTASMPTSQGQSASSRYYGSRAWGSAQPSSISPYEQHFAATSNNHQLLPSYPSEYGWPMPAIVPSSVDMNTHTISPSQTMTPVYSQDFDDDMVVIADQGAHVLPSPGSDSGAYDYCGSASVKSETHGSSHANERSAIKNEHSRSVHVSRTGAKGLKKRTSVDSGVSKSGNRCPNRKKDRNVNRKTQIVHAPNGTAIQLTQETPSGAKKPTHICLERHPNGRDCRRPFERPEHLKRHQKTHLADRDKFQIACPLDHMVYKCEKSLDRRDNWRDHLKTHLRISSSQRNARCTPEQMYAALRKNEPEAAEAEKTIGMLEVWWSQGKHLPNSSASTRQRH